MADLADRVIKELLGLACDPFQVSVAGGGVTARLAWSTTDATIRAAVDAASAANPALDALSFANMLFRQIVADMALSCEVITRRAEEHDAARQVFLRPSRVDSRTELSSPLSAEGANNDACQ